MKVTVTSRVCLVLASIGLSFVDGFSSHTTSRESPTALRMQPGDRRSFLARGVAFIAVATPFQAFAEEPTTFEDLSMPSEQDTKSEEVCTKLS